MYDCLRDAQTLDDVDAEVTALTVRAQLADLQRQVFELQRQLDKNEKPATLAERRPLARTPPPRVLANGGHGEHADYGDE